MEMIKNDMNFKQKSIFQDLILSFQNKNKLNGKIYFSNKFKKKKRQVIIYGKKGLTLLLARAACIL